MLFNVLCLLMIMLITLYLATQGMTSALVALVTAVFASLLAMGLMEPLQGIIGGYRPDYARGCTFLLVYFLTFSVTRISADMIITKNIKLPYLINRLAGGIVGFFTAMAVVGSIVIGIEMLPLGTSLIGYDRFPSETRMQGDTPGTVASGSSIWLAPERFTFALWRGASGRGLGGAQSFADIHPDIDVESYGYRNNLQFASNHSLPSELLEFKGGWVSSESKDYQPLGIPVADSGKKIVMVRVAVKRGTSTRTAADPDDNFRMTPTQIRLVSDKAHQYYPIGYLNFGRKFQALPLDTGQLVDDFVHDTVYQDWIFQINDNELPRFIEMKQLARVELANLREKPLAPLAAADYPQKPYLKERSTLSVTMSGRGTIREGKVYILQSSATYKDMQNQIKDAYAHVLEVKEAMETGGTGWSKDSKPGVPGSSSFQSATNIGLDIKNRAISASVPWSSALQLIMLTPAKPDGARNLVEYPAFIDATVIPMLNGISTGSAILTSGQTVDPSGKVELRDIPKGSQCIFATLKTDNAFYFWIREFTFDAGSNPSLQLDPQNASDPKIEP